MMKPLASGELVIAEPVLVAVFFGAALGASAVGPGAFSGKVSVTRLLFV
jgi:hypothetical protein